MDQPGASDQGIAIIGMAGRFPRAGSIERFWQSLRAGEELITFLDDAELAAAGIDQATLDHPQYVKAGGFLDDIDLFDAGFFGYTPREAEIIDPQQRLLLETAWEALERAGYQPETYGGLIGVYAGSNISTYLMFNLVANHELMAMVGTYQAMIANDKDYIATRISYKLNLRGPSIAVQTACSTSLVAVHLACQSLLNGECDLALAGGVNVAVPQRVGYWYQEGRILSPDGHCRAFDADAQGTVDGSGVGLVVLKRLEDALADGDAIHAVIRGSAINNDGALKVGYTAPSVEGQAAVISEALALAGVTPDQLSYIEAHGTGTPLGDPIEMEALTEVFREQTQRRGFCAIGSVKTSTGHLGAAAGVAGLIKATLALEHQLLPPSLHFQQPNPKIDWANSPFVVNTAARPWPADGQPRRAGVSSFGIGGTNAHVVLEEPPALEPSGPSRPWQLLVLSARSPEALAAASRNLAGYLHAAPAANLADVAYTLQVGRKAFGERLALVCRTPAEAAAALDPWDAQRVLVGSAAAGRAAPVVFMFPGQGTQYPGMGRELYESEPVFRDAVDRCAELLAPHLPPDGPRDLRALLYPAPEALEAAAGQLRETSYAQPALFVVEYALAQLWQSWGIQPQALIGHSIGEYVAATLASVWSLEDALQLVATRGRMTQRLPGGAMLSVSLPAHEVESLLDATGHRQLSLAAINGPRLCVVAGPTGAIAALAAELEARGIASRPLHTSHAFHSVMMTPIVDLFAAQVRRIRLNPPTLPVISNVSGTWLTAAEATDPGYWARHLRAPVRFADGVAELLGPAGTPSERIFLEVGPGRSLGAFVRQQADPAAAPAIVASLRHARDEVADQALLLEALGRLWLAGAAVDWPALTVDEQRRRVTLPTYPFERQRYWVERQGRAGTAPEQPQPGAAPAEDAPLQRHARPRVQSIYVAPETPIEQRIAAIWQELLGIEQVGVADNFFELGGHSLMGAQLIARLRDVFPIDLPVRSLFESTTIAELAEIVEEQLLEQIEALPEDEAQQLMDRLFGSAAEPGH